MADIFVDKIVHNKEIEKEWFRTTKGLIKINSYKKMLDLFLKASEEVADEYWKTHNIPKNFFKGDLKIMDIANQFNIKPLNRKLRICPFHKDTSPSLSLSNEKGVFNCFGCGKKGNIITFYAMLKKIKSGGETNARKMD